MNAQVDPKFICKLGMQLENFRRDLVDIACAEIGSKDPKIVAMKQTAEQLLDLYDKKIISNIFPLN